MRRMKANRTFLVPLLALALTAGCESTGPNTERGAATGAAIGAVGGAILGNNVGGGHHALLGAALGAAAGGVAGGAYGNRRDREQGTARQIIPPVNENESATGGYVAQPPPMPTSQPQDTYTPQPSPNSVWIRGHYDYVGGQNYQWVPGHWETPPAGATNYVPGHWQQQNQGYVWVRGAWQ